MDTATHFLISLNVELWDLNLRSWIIPKLFQNLLYVQVFRQMV